MSRCVDENAVVELIEGVLPRAEAERIDAHVDGCSRCADVLAAAARAQAPSSPGLGGAARPWLARGDVVDRYVILEWLGAGGMGQVYAADDPELRRRVALKLVRDEHAAAVRARLIREAQAMARLSHPNVVTVHDAGVAGERAFIAMELVAGRTLRAWMQERPRAWREVAAVFRQAGRGLAAAHAAGIVHRDFKPGNVLVGDDGRVQVTDFGLAREASDAGGDVAAGTPAYMAPEQRCGDLADARSDQYSFCVALAEALTGDRPAPSPASLAMPRRLRRILARGLARDPRDRYPSMAALLDDLEPAPRRGPALWIAAGTAAAAVAFAAAWIARAPAAKPGCDAAGAGVAALWSEGDRARVRDAFLSTDPDAGAAAWQSTDAALSAYTRDLALAHRASCEAARAAGAAAATEAGHAIRDRCLAYRADELRALIDVLAHAETRAAVANAVYAAHSLTTPSSCGGERGGRPDADGAAAAETRAVVWRGRALAEAGDYFEAEAVLARLVDDDELPPGVEARAVEELSRVHYALGNLAESERLLYRGLRAAQAAGDDHRAGAIAINLAGMLGVEDSRHDEAERWRGYAAATLERIGGDADLAFDVAAVGGSIARVHGDAETAVARFREALALRLARGMPSDPGLGETWTSLGTALDDLGDREGAAAAHRRGLAILERVLGRHHPRVEMAVKNLAVAEAALGNLDASRALCERSLDLSVRAAGPDSVHAAHALNNLASVEVQLGEADAAREHAARARDIYAAKLGDDHHYIAYAYTNLADAERVRGALAAAEEAAVTAIAIRERRLGPRHPEVAHSLAAHARVLFARGRRDAAGDAYERALAILVEARGEEHPEVAELRAEIASEVGAPAEGS